MFNHVRMSGKDLISIVAESGERVTVSRAELLEILREANTFVAVMLRQERERPPPTSPATPPLSPIQNEGALLTMAA